MRKRWTAATDVFELIPPVPGLVEQFKPKLKYLLIDEYAYTDVCHQDTGNVDARDGMPYSPA